MDTCANTLKPSKKKKKVTQLYWVIYILRENNNIPMTVNEILKIMLDRNLYEFSAVTPFKSINRLMYDHSDKDSRSVFGDPEFHVDQTTGAGRFNLIKYVPLPQTVTTQTFSTISEIDSDRNVTELDSEIVVINNEELEKEITESKLRQAQLCKIGEELGFQIWLPKTDRTRVMKEWTPAKPETLLDKLPFTFQPAVLKICTNIDVIFIYQDVIIALFEVEHTTSIASGIARILDVAISVYTTVIKSYIVAPDDRINKVKHEMNRPAVQHVLNDTESKNIKYIPYSKIDSMLTFDRQYMVRKIEFIDSNSIDLINKQK